MNTAIVTLITVSTATVLAAVGYALMRWSWRLRVLSRTAFVFGFVAMIVAIVAASAFIFPWWPLAVFATIVLVMVAIHSVASSRLAWLRMLCAARRNGIPLFRVLDSSRHSINPFDRGRLNRALAILEAGGNEFEALERLHLPAGVKASFGVILAFSGGLTREETRAAWRREQQVLAQRSRRGGHWLYLSLLSGMAAILTGFWMLFLYPVLRNMVEEWEGYSGATQAGFIGPLAIVLSHNRVFLTTYWALVTCHIVAGFMGSMQYTSIWPFSPWRASHRLWGMRLLPGLAAVARQRLPIAAFVSAMRATRPPEVMSRALRIIEEAERVGKPWTEALTERGYLGTKERTMLNKAIGLGSLAWACDIAAERLMRRWETRQEVVNAAVFPILIVLLGVVSAIVPVAMISTLAWLIFEV